MSTFYVYKHVKNGCVFYIGMGKGGRAIDTNSARNPYWNNAFNFPGKFLVKICASFSDRKDAVIYERELIRKESPYANCTHVRKPNKHKDLSWMNFKNNSEKVAI